MVPFVSTCCKIPYGILQGNRFIIAKVKLTFSRLENLFLDRDETQEQFAARLGVPDTEGRRDTMEKTGEAFQQYNVPENEAWQLKSDIQKRILKK